MYITHITVTMLISEFRRGFEQAIKGSCIVSISSNHTMSVTLPALPYAYNALEPHIGQRTVEIHHDKHHAKYVDNVNSLVKGTDLENADLVTIIKS